MCKRLYGVVVDWPIMVRKRETFAAVVDAEKFFITRKRRRNRGLLEIEVFARPLYYHQQPPLVALNINNMTIMRYGSEFIIIRGFLLLWDLVLNTCIRE